MSHLKKMTRIPPNDLKLFLALKSRQAFQQLGLDASYGHVVISGRPELADFQCNGALPAAKIAKQQPKVLAEKVIGELEKTQHVDWKSQPPFPEVVFKKLEVAGPGFVNMILSDGMLTVRAQQMMEDERCGLSTVLEPRTVIIDYGGPNVAKPMHVGHLRASIIGESLKRLYRFRGDKVYGDAHFGDWGFQMGLLIVAVGDEQPESVFHDENKVDSFPETSPVSLEDLERLYPMAATKAKEDAEFRDRARKATAELQAGRPGYRALWKHFANVSRTALERDFGSLDVNFDLWLGESDADVFIPDMVEDLKQKGLAVLDNGALIVQVSKEGDKARIPPLLVMSSEGSAMYGTTDLATIVQRRKDFNFDLCIYCVDQRQSDHFEQVFRAAYLAGYAQPGQLYHAPNGTMNGPDGKPFKTRAGGTLKLHDLVQMATEKARERLLEAQLGKEMSKEEFEDIAHKVAVAALKFSDLSNHRVTSYMFDLDKFTSFEGRTGPYLMYQAVRIKSLLRKGREQGLEPGPFVKTLEPTERDVIICLDSAETSYQMAYDGRTPNTIAEHVFRLASVFARFYGACSVLNAPDDETKRSRLTLASLVLKQMLITMDILGIQVPERM